MLQKYRNYIILTILVLFSACLMWIEPIPQAPEYHNFADKRPMWGIPNFWDVMSNLPMFFIGLYGLIKCIQRGAIRPGFVAKWLSIVLCLGMILAGLGSAYYHWAPDTPRLVWDRLPMTLIFMPVFALLIYDFIGRKPGEWAFYILVPLGIFSVWYWSYTEQIGEGDLRLYVFVQFFPMLVAPFILWLYPRKTNYVRYIWFILGWYVLAKICEYYDPAIFEFMGFWSGHTLKHLLSAVSLYYVLKLLLAWEENFLKDGGV